jgi:hypothetical protein
MSNLTRRDVLRATKQRQDKLTRVEWFGLGWLTGVIPYALMALWSALVDAAI